MHHLGLRTPARGLLPGPPACGPFRGLPAFDCLHASALAPPRSPCHRGTSNKKTSTEKGRGLPPLDLLAACLTWPQSGSNRHDVNEPNYAKRHAEVNGGNATAV